MPKGSKLKELWADPEWRARRLKDLRENRKWIEARSRMIGDENLRHQVVAVRRRRAIRKNYDLERENATLWWLLNNKSGSDEGQEPESRHEPENRPSEPVVLTAGPYIRRIEELEETIVEFKRALATDRELLALRLVGLEEQEARLVAAIYRREMLPREGAIVALYPDDPDRRAENSRKLVDVYICRARRRLKPFGVRIDTMWGEGHRMPPDSKAKLKALMDRQFLKQAAE